MSNEKVRLASLVAIGVLMMLPLPGCGTGPTPTPTKHLISSQNFTVLGTVAANALGLRNDAVLAQLTVSGTGTEDVEIDADWTLSSDDIEIFFFSGSCTAQQALAQQCTQIARTTTSVKPQQLTIPGISSGTYAVGIANFGPNNESGNFQAYGIY